MPSTVSFSNEAVTVDQGNGSNTYTGTAFNTTLSDQKPGSTTTPAFEINTGQLILKGGTLTTTETGTYVVNGANLDYTLYDPSFNTVSNGTLQLTQTSVNNGVRTFSLTTGTTNLISLVAAAGSGYTIQVRFHATYQVNGTGIPNTATDSNSYNAMFSVTGARNVAPTLTATTVLVAPNGAANTTYDANNVSAAPDFNGANLGTFDVNTGQLVLNGGTATTTENGTNTISSVTLYYRVRASTNGGGGFNQIALTQTSLTTNPDASRTRTFALSTAAQNLLAGIGTVGNYNVDVYLQASGINSATTPNTTFTITDNNNGNNYIASFTVNGTPFVTTVWTGGINDNWFDTRNWTSGVPNATINAVIPNFNSGANTPYPNIYSDVVKGATPATTETNPDGTIVVVPASPGYDNTGSGNAQVRNLTLQGVSQLDRSILRLVTGRLDVYGDFTNPQGSFIQRSAPIISFKATGDQTISGSANGFSKVEIDGGVNSVKTLVTSFDIKSGGYLKFIHGILVTNISQVSTNFVLLAGTTTDPTTQVVTPAAQLQGETEASYFRGFLKTTQTAVSGTPQNFSNIGLTLTFTGNQPGDVFVTRNTGDNYPPSAFGGSSPKPGIRRVFGVQPGNPNTNTGGLQARVEFRFLDNELTGLRTSNGAGATFNGSVDESRLALYVSSTGGDTFGQLGRDSNNSNILVKNIVTTFATFTLSEQQTQLPLPVTVVSFDAKRMGANALVTWETAAELNSKGYNVQVSTNGTEFHTLGFVPSVSPNNVKATKYSYTDTEKNKAGLRYYRLEQVDMDGTIADFVPRVVSFDGNATEGGVVASAYPNPFINEMHLNIQSTRDGNASISVSDVTGRTVAQRQIALINGANDVEFANANELKNGVYLMRITMPTGEVQNLKVVKQ